jgi:hypothetical protein
MSVYGIGIGVKNSDIEIPVSISGGTLDKVALPSSSLVANNGNQYVPPSTIASNSQGLPVGNVPAVAAASVAAPVPQVPVSIFLYVGGGAVLLMLFGKKIFKKLL